MDGVVSRRVFGLELLDRVGSVLDDKFGVHDLSHVWSLEVVWRDHPCEDFIEFGIGEQAVLVHLLILFKEELQVVQKPVLELDCLTHVLVIHDAFDAMAEVRGTQVKLVIHRSAFEFNWQFHLAWTSGGNLKQNDAKGEAVS